MTTNKTPASGSNHQAGYETTKQKHHSRIASPLKAYAVAGLLALPAFLLGILTLAAIGLLLEALQ